MTADSSSPVSYTPSPATPERRGFWRRHWRRALAIFLFLYVSSYLVLSYRGRQESKLLGIEGFFYLPLEESRTWQIGHYSLLFFYWPLNQVDQWVFHGEPACRNEPMWRMGEYKP